MCGIVWISIVTTGSTGAGWAFKVFDGTETEWTLNGVGDQ